MKYLVTILILLFSGSLLMAQESLSKVCEVDYWNATRYSGGRNIARTPAGNVVVVFEPGSNYTNGSQDIHYAIYNSIFGSWDVAKLSHSPSNATGTPAIVADPDSNVCYAVWKQKNESGDRDLMFSKLTFLDQYTSVWSDPVVADNVNTNTGVCTIDIADDGTLFGLFSVWDKGLNYPANIYCSRSEDGGKTWTTDNLTREFPTPNELPFEWMDVSLAPGKNGVMYAGWEDKPKELTNSYEILFTKYTPGQGWERPEVITPIVEGEAFLQHYVDGCTPRDGAVSVYVMGPESYKFAGESSVIYYDNGTSEALSCMFNPYYIVPPETKDQWVSDVVDFFSLNPDDSILFVDDDNAYNNEKIMTDALDKIAAPYTVFDCGNLDGMPERVPSADLLKKYALVIWLTGDDYKGNLAFWNINDTLNTDLKSYMDTQGKKLWVIGRDWIYDRYGAAPDTFQAGDFMYDYLGIASYDCQSWANDGKTGVAELDLVTDNGLQVSGVEKLSWGNAGIWQGKVSMASDPEGHVHIVYDQDKGKHVYYKMFDGTNWTDPIQIDATPDSVPIVRPNIACDPNYGLYVVWTQATGTDTVDGKAKTVYNVFYATSPDGGKTWNAPQQLSQTTVANADGYSTKNPTIGEQVRKPIEGVFEGGADVVWSEYNPESSMGYYIMYARIPYVGTLTSLDDAKRNRPYTFALKSNYPNPFNPQTTLQFEIPSQAHVQLEIFNALGQKVATVVNETLKPGIYKRTWQAGSLPSGIYFARLKAAGREATQKLVLMK